MASIILPSEKLFFVRKQALQDEIPLSTYISTSPSNEIPLESFPSTQVLFKKARLKSGISLSSPKSSLTRPSTAAQSLSLRPKSTSTSGFLSEAQTPKRTSTSPSSFPIKSGFKARKVKEYTFQRIKSARTNLEKLLPPTQNKADPLEKIKNCSAEIIANIKKYQSKKSMSPSKNIDNSNPKFHVHKNNKAKNYYFLTEKLLPEHNYSYQSPTIEGFIQNIKAKINTSQSREVQDILGISSDSKKGYSYALKIGVISPKSAKNKKMFEPFEKEIDDLLLTRTQKLKNDLVDKKVFYSPKSKKVHQDPNLTPLVLSNSFNTKKYCQGRGIKSITQALNYYDKKSWKVLLDAPHNLSHYLKTGEDEVYDQTYFHFVSPVHSPKRKNIISP